MDSIIRYYRKIRYFVVKSKEKTINLQDGDILKNGLNFID